MPDKGSSSKSFASKRGAPMNGSNSAPVNIDSESDSEGFLEEYTPSSSKANGKVATNQKAGGKLPNGKAPRDSSSPPSLTGRESKGTKSSSVKGGKGGKGSGKCSTSTAAPRRSDGNIKIDPNLPPEASVLTNCEAVESMQEINGYMDLLREDPNIKIPDSFDKALQYAKECSHFCDSKALRRALTTLHKFSVNDSEMCLIANICPESVEEVYSLVSSLKVNASTALGPTRELVDELIKLKSPDN